MELFALAGAAAAVLAIWGYRAWRKRRANVRKPTTDDIYPMW